MFNFTAIAGNSYRRYMTAVARRQAMQVLARQSDVTLRDIGISRELLNSGPAGWPWHAPDVGAKPVRTSLDRSAGDLPVHTGGTRAVETRAVETSAVETRAVETRGGQSRRTAIGKAYHKLIGRARAIRELNGMSDRELRDLGVTRATIVEAVTHGRPGIDVPHTAIQSAGTTRAETNRAETNRAEKNSIDTTSVDTKIDHTASVDNFRGNDLRSDIANVVTVTAATKNMKIASDDIQPDGGVRVNPDNHRLTNRSKTARAA